MIAMPPPALQLDMGAQPLSGQESFDIGSQNLAYSGAVRLGLEVGSRLTSGWQVQLRATHAAYDFVDQQLPQSRHSRDAFRLGLWLEAPPSAWGLAPGGGYEVDGVFGGSSLLSPNADSLPFATMQIFQGPGATLAYSLPLAGLLGLGPGAAVRASAHLMPLMMAGGSPAVADMGLLWGAQAACSLAIPVPVPIIGPLSLSAGLGATLRRGWDGGYQSFESGPMLSLGRGS